MMFSITALANRTGSFGARFGLCGLLARGGMVRLWHTKLLASILFAEAKDSGYKDRQQEERNQQMMHYWNLLWDWNNLDAVRAVHSFLEGWALVFFALLVLFDVLAHLAEEKTVSQL